MNAFAISNHELAELRGLHRQLVDKRDADRVKAVIMLAGGWSAAKVAEALLMDPDTVRKHYKRYQDGGFEGLLSRKSGGSKAWLTDEQMIELDCHLEQTLYISAKEIANYVKQRWNVVYSERGITDLLHRLGYTYKKPKLVPGKADVPAQENFKEEYEDLKKNKEKSDPIYFMDATHPHHNPIAGYGWIKRGKDHAVPTNTGRNRLNINGAICIETMTAVIRFDDVINAQSTIALFKQIESVHPGANNIYIICDNARYYRSRLVNEYLEKSRITLIFLPPYSPNLNLIERYWKYFKKNILYGKYYDTFDKFKRACMDFFGEPENHVDALRSLLTENFQIIGNDLPNFES